MREVEPPKFTAPLLLFVLTLVLFLPLAGNGFINFDDPISITANPVVQRGLTGAGAHWAFTTLRSGNWIPLLFYALSLMSKPMLVTLPLLLLLIDRWPLGRRLPLASAIREKAPFFLVAAAAAVVALLAQRAGGAVIAFDHLPLQFRLSNAPTAYVAYLLKTLWPSGLAVFYPHPGDRLSWLQAGGSLLVLVGISRFAFARRAQPWLLVGWAWFLITLLPVIGLVQIGAQAMADRYTYLPLIGLFVIAVWAVADAIAAYPRLRPPAFVVAAALLAVLALLTRRQLGYWKDSRTLFTRALAVTEANWLAHNNLGVALAGEGRFVDAADEYWRALLIKPGYGLTHSNLGVALMELGQGAEAKRHFELALVFDKKREEAHYRLGVLLADEGRNAEAIVHLRAAVALAPEHAEARSNLGALLARSGDRVAAREQFVEALRLKPVLVEARENLERLERLPATGHP